ncbi:MAG: OmpH family outer membrane protein [Kiritimatiellia bacterium]
MMRTSKWLLWALTGMVVAATCWAGELKIATVDLEKVFSAHPKTKAAEAELKATEDVVQAEVEKILAEGRALGEEVEKLREAAKSPMLSDAARMEKQNAAEEKMIELQAFQARARRTQEAKLKQMAEEVKKTRQSIVDELTEAVQDFAKEEGWDLILDSSGMTMNMVPLTIYANPSLDVTEQLIKRLNPTGK